MSEAKNEEELEEQRVERLSLLHKCLQSAASVAPVPFSGLFTAAAFCVGLALNASVNRENVRSLTERLELLMPVAKDLEAMPKNVVPPAGVHQLIQFLTKKVEPFLQRFVPPPDDAGICKRLAGVIRRCQDKTAKFEKLHNELTQRLGDLEFLIVGRFAINAENANRNSPKQEVLRDNFLREVQGLTKSMMISFNRLEKVNREQADSIRLEVMEARDTSMRVSALHDQVVAGFGDMRRDQADLRNEVSQLRREQKHHLTEEKMMMLLLKRLIENLNRQPSGGQIQYAEADEEDGGRRNMASRSSETGEPERVEGRWCVFWDNDWRPLPCELNSSLSASFRTNPTEVVEQHDLFKPGTLRFDFINMTMKDVDRDVKLWLKFAEPRVEGSWCVFWEKEWRPLPPDLNSRLSASYHHDPAPVVETTELFHQPGRYLFNFINMTVTDVTRNNTFQLRFGEPRVEGLWCVFWREKWLNLPSETNKRLSTAYHSEPAVAVEVQAVLFGQPGTYLFDLINMTVKDVSRNVTLLLRFAEPRVEGWWCVFCEKWCQLPWELNNRLSTTYRHDPTTVVKAKDLFSQSGKYFFNLINMTATDVKHKTPLALRFVELRVEGSWCVFWKKEWRVLPCELNNRLSTTCRHNPTAAVKATELFRQPGTYSFNLINMTMTDDTGTLPLRFVEMPVEGSWWIFWQNQWCRLPNEINNRLSTAYHHNAAVVQEKDLFKSGTYSFNLITMTVTDDTNATLALRFGEPRVECSWRIFWDRDWCQLPSELNSQLSTSYRTNPTQVVEQVDLFEPGRYLFDLINMTVTHIPTLTLDLRQDDLYVLMENEWRKLPSELNSRLTASYRANPRIPVPVQDLFDVPGKYLFNFINMKVTDVTGNNNATLALRFAELRQEGTWRVFWKQRWRQLPWKHNNRLSTAYHSNPTATVKVTDLWDLPGTCSFDLINMIVTVEDRMVTLPLKLSGAEKIELIDDFVPDFTTLIAQGGAEECVFKVCLTRRRSMSRNVLGSSYSDRLYRWMWDRLGPTAPGVQLKNVVFINNPSLMQHFRAAIEQLNVADNWRECPEASKLDSLCGEFRFLSAYKSRIALVIHLTDDEKERAILSCGFSMERNSDDTIVGKGITFTCNAEYAKASSLSIIFSWVAIGNPYFPQTQVTDRHAECTTHFGLTQNWTSFSPQGNTPILISFEPALCCPFAVAELTPPNLYS